MRLPAVAIAAALSGGILLGRVGSLPSFLFARSVLACGFAAVCLFLLSSLFLAARGWLWPAALLSLLSWCGLGVLAIEISSRPLPPEHVLVRLAAHQFELKTPLRWHGTLRDEPAHLPWGYGLELELSGVETAEGLLPLRGGMRVGFTPKGEDTALPDVHAGDELSVLAQARLPQVFRDAGAFDRRAYLAQQNVHLLATLRASALLERGAVAPASIHTLVARLRARLRAKLSELYPGAPRTAAILRAMLLGDRSFVDREESADFQKTGVFHVLVVAGLHVGALTIFVFWLGRKLRLPRLLATMILLATLLAYVAVVEQRAPVLRAGLMAGIVVLAGFFYRRLEVLNSAAVAAVILLLAKPAALFDASFQFSFLAMGCIAGIALPWLERHVQPYVSALRAWRDVTSDGAFSAKQVQFRLDLRDWVDALTKRPWMSELITTGLRWSLLGVELVVVSIVLQLGMLPMMARDFHRIPLQGPAVNLLAVPLTGVIVPLGFLTLGSAMIWPTLGRALAWPLGWLVGIQSHVVAWFAGMAHGSYRIPGPPVWVTVVFFASGVVLAAFLRIENGKWRWLKWAATACGIAAALVIATFPFPPRVERGKLEVDVLDVGQGDSILVVSPKGSTLLVDGGGRFAGFRGQEEAPGPDPGEEAVSAYLWSRGIRGLDAVALTHAHQDHIGGLAAVLENFSVRQLWLSRETLSPALARLKEEAAQKHILVEHELRGQKFDWDGVQVEFLWPQIAPTEVAPAPKNNDSLVMRLQFGERSVLLPGDAEKQAEYAMLNEDDPDELHADVLKVGHHGSKNSTMPEFLERVAPKVAIISAGEGNPYGHPSGELLDRLEQRRVRILRTDEQGEISTLTDGKEISVKCFVECEEKDNAEARRAQR